MLGGGDRWCQHSKKAAPEFAAAAKILMARESMNETVGLAKVSAHIRQCASRERSASFYKFGCLNEKRCAG
eukprot:1971363-Rhodomonas_salina.3